MFYFRKRLPTGAIKFRSKPIYLSLLANPSPPRRREACRKAAHGLREKGDRIRGRRDQKELEP